jgi:hypothetical protein
LTPLSWGNFAWQNRTQKPLSQLHKLEGIAVIDLTEVFFQDTHRLAGIVSLADGDHAKALMQEQGSEGVLALGQLDLEFADFQNVTVSSNLLDQAYGRCDGAFRELVAIPWFAKDQAFELRGIIVVANFKEYAGIEAHGKAAVIVCGCRKAAEGCSSGAAQIFNGSLKPSLVIAIILAPAGIGIAELAEGGLVALP